VFGDWMVGQSKTCNMFMHWQSTEVLGLETGLSRDGADKAAPFANAVVLRIVEMVDSLCGVHSALQGIR